MRTHLYIALTLTVASALPVRGQETADRQSWTTEQWSAHFQEEAARYVIANPDNNQTLELQPEPLLKWGNPQRGGHEGNLFVWRREGRPEVIGSLFKYTVGERVREKHALHSLAEGPLRAEFNGMTVWNPVEPGLTWFTPENAPQPAAAAKAQSLQMRGISRKYTVTLTDEKQVVTELRLLPQPILEYAAPSRKILNGAIFAYAIATDPEAMLVVELVQQEGKEVYRCGFARSHYGKLQAVDENGKEIWSLQLIDMRVNPAGNPLHLQRTYNSFSPY